MSSSTHAIKLITASALFLCTSSVFAQHNGHNMATQSGAGAVNSAPYADLTKRSIKALSDEDTKALLEGRGMTLALPAELNGYPGPMHVLENDRALGLSDAQRKATADLMQSHKAQVRDLGKQLVAIEKQLDTLFATKQADAAKIDALTQEIGKLQAQIRAAHLRTHITQSALLEPTQIAQYQKIRGYTSN
jgi:peptidoglycan hydrolase CwlO-like protein